jgi:ADP-ribosylglycohydrolase
MIGAIAGDIIGSAFERIPIKTIVFPLFSPDSTFTDDTVLSVAVAHSILCGSDFASSLKYFGRKYPHAGYGLSFFRWLHSENIQPYNSWGNGSAMRVSPVGFAFNTIEDVLRESKRSAEVTHNHPEGIKGAQATALAIFLARSGMQKTEIRTEISRRFGYNLDRTLDEIRPGYRFDISCQGTVPEAIIAFLESNSFEDAIRKGISLGGDSDTIGCIVGGIAQAFFKHIPQAILSQVGVRLPEEFQIIINQFNARFGIASSDRMDKTALNDGD